MHRDLRVAGWLVQPSLGRISKSGLTVQVRAKVMDLLVYFAQHPGEVVSKDVLLRDVWGTEAISESALTRTIAELRQALGDDVEQPSMLETIPKRGYRLIAPVISETGDEARSSTAGRPTPDRDGRRRAWVWALAGAGALFVLGVVWMIPRGSPEPHEPMRSRQVTRLEGVERDPSLDPGGSQVAFVWNNDLYVKAVDSGEPNPIARNVFETAWSPDGQWIATYRNDGPPGHHKLLLVSPTGGSEREIGSFYNFACSCLAWSPDGRWIALTHKERPELSPAVFLVSTKTGERRRISTPPPEAAFDADPIFSNDGRRLAFFRNFSTGFGRFEIHILGIDGEGDRTVRTLEGLPMDLGWTSDDGGLVLAMQTPDNLAGLWRVSVDGKTFSAYEVGENAWRFSIKGDRLVYQRLVEDTKVWLASGPAAPVKQTPRPFRPEGRNDSVPRFSPDGGRAAFVSAGMIWVCQYDGTNCSQLTFQGQAIDPRWSPNGDSIVYVNNQGNNDLYVVSVQGGLPRALTNDAASDGTPEFSRDGQWVYFRSKRTPEWRIWRVRVTDGIPEQVSDVGGTNPAEASDGWFYLSRPMNGTIERMRSDGSRRHVLKGGLPTPVSWTLWRDMPLVRNGDVIVKVDPQTRTLSEFWRLDVRSLIPDEGRRGGGCNSFDVSTDGRWIVYCVAQPQGDIILVENFR
jgi:Tol biopolymer transport system component/DNA-binding winged helix-turn-helix (wHTH) protein